MRYKGEHAEMQWKALLNSFSADEADCYVYHHCNVKSMPIKPSAFMENLMRNSRPINKRRYNWFTFLSLARLMDRIMQGAGG